MKEYNGQLIAKGFKFALIVSRFNDFITEKLLEGAVDAIDRSGGDKEAIDILRVPGAFEIPLVAKRVARADKYDAVIFFHYKLQPLKYPKMLDKSRPF